MNKLSRVATDGQQLRLPRAAFSDAFATVRRARAISGFLVVLAVGATGVVVFVATRSDLWVPALALVAAPVVLSVCLRWPLVALAAFTALIPLEDRLKVGDLATAGKIAGAVFVATYAVTRFRAIRLSVMPSWGWLYIAWGVLSVGWALRPEVSQGELPTLIQLFVISVLVADAVATNPGIVRPLLWIYSAAAGVASMIAIGSYLSGSVAIGTRVSAAEDQDVAQFAVQLLPALIFVLYEVLEGRLVGPGVILAGLTTTAIILSGTRGAWVSAAVVGVVFLLPQLSMRRRVAAVMVVGALLLVAVQLPGVSDLISERAGLALESGGAGRTDIWTVATHIFQSAPIAGVGFANFPIAFTSQFIQAADVSGLIVPGSGSHSILFGTLAELGVVGLAVLGLFIAPLILRRGWGPDARTIQAALASLIIAGFFLDIIANRKQVWLLIGIAAGLTWLVQKREAYSPPVPESERVAMARRRRLRRALRPESTAP